MLAKLLLIFTFAAPSFAGSYQFLVYRAAHFQQDRYATSLSPLEYKLFIGTGKKNINEAGGQPFLITTYQLNYDGQYALWNVDDSDVDERKSIESMTKKGFIVLMSSGDVVDTYDGSNGWRKEPKFSGPLIQLPTDFYKVEVSTN